MVAHPQVVWAERRGQTRYMPGLLAKLMAGEYSFGTPSYTHLAPQAPHGITGLPVRQGDASTRPGRNRLAGQQETSRCPAEYRPHRRPRG